MSIRNIISLPILQKKKKKKKKKSHIYCLFLRFFSQRSISTNSLGILSIMFIIVYYDVIVTPYEEEWYFLVSTEREDP